MGPASVGAFTPAVTGTATSGLFLALFTFLELALEGAFLLDVPTALVTALVKAPKNPLFSELFGLEELLLILTLNNIFLD
jgi:hypothetical protein